MSSKGVKDVPITDRCQLLNPKRAGSTYDEKNFLQMRISGRNLS